MKSHLTRVSFFCAVFGAIPALAQSVPIPPPTGFQSPPSLSFGDFIAGGQIGLTAAHTTNLKGDPSEQDAEKAGFSFAGQVSSNWDRHAVSARANFVEDRSVSTSDLQVTASSYGVSARYDIGDIWSVDTVADVNESIVGTTNPDQLTGNINGVSRVSAFALGATRRTGSNDLRLVARWQETLNQTDITTANFTAISASDRDELDLVAQYTWNVEGGTRYVNGAVALIEYPNATFNRDSDGILLGAGFTQVSGSVSYSGWLAGIYQEFNVPTIGPHFGVIGNLNAVYSVSPQTTVGATIARVFDDQNLGATSAGVFLTNLSFAAQHEFSDTLYIRGELTNRLFEQENLGVATDSLTFTGRIAWRPSERLTIPFDVSLSRQNARSAAFSSLEFDTYSFSVGATYSF